MKSLIKTSRYLSKLLRHNPEDLKMDKKGYVLTTDILDKLNITLEELKYIVDNNDKKRFSFNEDLSKIRASQGHSLNVDVELERLNTKHFLDRKIEFLYHGTVERNLESISNSGLKKMKRNHVHLSIDEKTASKVGKRYGDDLIILKINWKSLIMEQNIYISKNGVYLTDDVDVKHIINI